MVDTKTIDSVIKHYEQLSPRYAQLIEEVIFSIKHNIDDKLLKIAEIKGRLKEKESLEEKLKRKHYEDLSDIPDVAGVRIVCLYEPEIEIVSSVIESEFHVVKKENKTIELGENLMGYQGSHFVVQLGSNYSGPRYDQVRGLNCEIQVRTVLQDAWSLISHHLVYKHESSIPLKIRRNLNNVMSLLEIAQGVFDSVQEQRGQYLETITNKNEDPEKFLSQSIDHDTVIAYTLWKYPSLPTDDYWNDRFIRDIDKDKYKTLKDIDIVVESAREAVAKYKEENPNYFAFGTDYLTKSFGFVDKDFRREHNFAKFTLDAFRKYEPLLSSIVGIIS